ncbi:hypothetical protein [Microbacterium sp. KR10-403]|uniref:hypothetical protein n=1 Tax=Microbacterium sp. KR10-403 TaxID=3158581 RepID=UPI0032E4DAD5
MTSSQKFYSMLTEAEAAAGAAESKLARIAEACDKVLAVKVVGSSEGDAAAAGIAAGIRSILNDDDKENDRG